MPSCLQSHPPGLREHPEFPGTTEALARSLEQAPTSQARLGAARGADLEPTRSSGHRAGGGANLGMSLEGGGADQYQDSALNSSIIQSLMLQQKQQQLFQEKTFDMMATLLKDSQATKDKEEGQAKRKNKEESTTSPQEPIMILEESYRIEDDGHETLDTKLRQRLRPINADPKVWWVKGAFNRVESPVLGASLYTEHLMPGMVAEKTILMAHDRGAHIELKNYLTRNSNVFSESKKKIKVTDDLVGEMHLGIRTDWQPATTVWEAVDAGLNYAAVEFMVRSYNYSPLAMIRCLHECR